MFNRFVSWIKGVRDKLLNRDVMGRLQKQAPVSDEMYQAIAFWNDLYLGKAPWLAQNKQSLSLPSAIASELARMATIEMDVTIGGSPRAGYLQKQLAPFLAGIRRHVEYACATGGLIFKPYVSGDAISVDCVKTSAFFPLAFDSKGDITSAAFVEQKRQGNTFYHRLEEHYMQGGGCVIRNSAYRSYSASDLGTPIPLDSVPEWAGLEPETHIANLEAPLFAYFRMPQGNIIDPDSPLGVSAFARAVTLIEEADKQYQRFLWEFEGGELAVHAQSGMFMLDKKGRPILPNGRERLYRTLNFDTMDSSQKPIDVFSPALRDISLLNGLNDLLMRVEDTCGLARGTFSNPQEEARTATEIKILKQRSYSTVSDTQKSLEAALSGLIKAMDALATLYGLAPQGTYETVFSWDDSIVTDRDAEVAVKLQEVAAGILSRVQYRMWRYGEDEETARKNLPEMEEMLEPEVE